MTKHQPEMVFMRNALSCGLILLLVFTHDGHAQSMNAPDGPCRGVVITSDLTECLDLAWKKSDAKLNDTYARVQRVLDPEEKRRLVQSQRFWIKYRDATCDAEYQLYGGGTGGPPARLACLEAETRAREASLQRSYGWRVEKFGG
ncbi:DUF1311 domain-containing protein [Pseudoluteimonas lycopersici]|uniref:DUF1311 domain-containing protein n=1 Tax=Pseudoluteimonas lycopersici TaxID=1324796 RepID=A0A516V5A2_9GAMM|nr:lysozyme inhibitor LprI family protein [Lysobacter lycopersici]QDQ73709.1 DUF1311 domain-containing protein [Lysobacter lycopersici]